MGTESFEDFKRVVLVAVHFKDSLSLTDITELINEWYVIYKERVNNYKDPHEFLLWQLDPEEVNRDTHDFWLDPKGEVILYLMNN